MAKLSIEETAELSMNLIAIAGGANGLNLTALKQAKKGNFDQAIELMIKAKEELRTVHTIHAEIIQKEAQGFEPYINTLFIHAQDHFANALLYTDLTKYIVDLYHEIAKIKVIND